MSACIPGSSGKRPKELKQTGGLPTFGRINLLGLRITRAGRLNAITEPLGSALTLHFSSPEMSQLTRIDTESGCLKVCTEQAI